LLFSIIINKTSDWLRSPMLVFWQLLSDASPAKDGSVGLAARLPVPSSSSDRRALSHSLTSADELRRHGFLFCVRDVLHTAKINSTNVLHRKAQQICHSNDLSNR